MKARFLHSRPRIGPAIALALLATTAQSGTAALAKYLVRDYPVTQILCTRNAVLVLVMGLIVLSLRSSPPLQFVRLPLQIGRGVLPLLASLFMFVSLKYMPLAEATSIMFISPLLITILSIFVLREPVSGPHWAAVVLGFIGVGIVLRPGTDAGHWAALLLLFAAAFIAIYQIITKVMTLSFHPFSVLLITAIVGTAATIVFVPFFWISPSPLGWVLLVASGAFYGLGHYCWFRALQIAPASALAPFIYTQIITATILGAVVFQEIPDLQVIIGSILIVGAGLIVYFQSGSRDDQKR